MKKYYLCIFALSIVNVVNAQEDIQGNTLDELIIKENRLQVPFQQSTRNIQIVTKDDIKKLPATSLNEVLSYVNGVDIRQRGPFGSQADISIDGGSFEQTMILWNGVKMGDAQTAHHTMNLPIPLEAIERVEVLKGPAARIYGINALTGAVNIVTKAKIEDFVSVNLYGGSSFKNKDEGDGSGIYAGGGLQTVVNLHNQNTQHLFGITHDNYNGQRYNSAFKNTKFLYQGNLDIDTNHSVNLLAGYIDNEFGANGYYAAPHDKESYEFVKTLVVSLGSKHNIGKSFTIQPRISNRYNEDDYRFYRYDITKARSLHYSNALSVEINSVYTTTLGDFGIGYELRAETINSSNLGAHDRENHGWFAEYRRNFINKLFLNAGAYWNYNSAYGFKWYPGVDIAYQIKDYFKVQANLGTSQRIPSFTDLYVNQKPGNIGNENLQPEKAFQYELGFQYNKNGLRVNGSFFQRDVSDFIDWIRNETSNPYQPHNIGNQIMNGISLKAQNVFEVAPNHLIKPNISYQHLSPVAQENTEILSKYVLESLKHQVIFGLNYEHNNFDIQLQNRYLKRELKEGYLVTDIKLSKAVNRFTIYTQASNIFGTSYSEIGAIPLPSRWFQLGINYRTNL